LNKTQPSFKQVVSTTSVKDDPLILLDKQSYEGRLVSPDQVMEVVLREAEGALADERERERLYSRFVTRCLLDQVPMTVGAAEFYGWLDRKGHEA
jgi:hypothetical protein